MNSYHRPNFIVILFLLLGYMSASCINRSYAQNTVPFNRFQYHNYKWKVLHTPIFSIYFPRGYDSLASLASVQLPDITAEVKQSLGVGPKSIPNIVIYPSIDQLYESNIGLHQNEVQTFPTINKKGNRMVLAFDGSYEHFREHLKIAWTRFSWEEQFRNDAEEQLSSKQPKMPFWFKEGAIGFTGKGWTMYDEHRFQEYVLNKQILNWEQLTMQEPVLTGRAFCYFLSQKYRQDIVMQLIYEMKQRKSLSRALRLVTKQKMDSLTDQCMRYYMDRSVSNETIEKPQIDTLSTWLENTFKGKLLAIHYNSMKTVMVIVIERANNRLLFLLQVKDLFNEKIQRKQKPLASCLLPPWIQEYSGDPYPLVNWNKEVITVTLPVKGKIKILAFNDRGMPIGIPNVLYGVDGVQSLAQWNINQWLLSAYRRGRSDIVAYDANSSRYTALTKDLADHTELSLSSSGASGIFYRSGYPADSIYHLTSVSKPYGVYFKEINRDLKTAAASNEIPVAQDSAYIKWHGFKSKRGFALINTSLGFLDTLDVNTNAIPIPKTMGAKAISPWLQDYLRLIEIRDSIKASLPQPENTEPSFLGSILAPSDTKKMARQRKDSLRQTVAYTGKKTSPYILQLYSAYFSAQVNNDYFINRFQPYQAYLGTFKFPEVGAMLSAGLSDLFENHHFNIGYRMPVGTEGSDFFVRYENTAKKTDWHVLFFRKVESLEPDGSRDWRDHQGNPYPAAAKVKTHYYELGFHTPLHYDWSVDYSLAARRDRTIFLATDRYSLDYERLQSWWGIGNIVLKVYKMKPTIPLLEKGWQGKILLDGMASSGKQSTMVFGSQIDLGYSQPVIKDITVVARGQAGYSLGQSKILYNFGGIDKNLVTRVDTSVDFAQDAPYAFQTLVTPFRGYQQNSIYGSRYFLINVDVYFPLFRTLIPLQTGFSSLKNLQFGIFTDFTKAGNAIGLPVSKNQLASFGYSMRTMLAGYPLRFDMAWPVNLKKEPIWYLSLTLR